MSNCRSRKNSILIQLGPGPNGEPMGRLATATGEQRRAAKSRAGLQWRGDRGQCSLSDVATDKPQAAEPPLRSHR